MNYYTSFMNVVKLKSLTAVSLLQYAKQNLHNTNLPLVKIDERSEVTEETMLIVLRRALSQYSLLQGPDGHWPGGYSGILFILPLMV
jgi:hypothetical protein